MHPLDEVRLGMARLNFHLVHEHPEPLFMGELPRSYDTVPAPVVINMCGVFAHPEPPVRFTFGMPLLDSLDASIAPTREEIERFLESIHPWADRGPTYWHCHAGLNRSGLAVASYLHLYRGMRISDAIASLRTKRSPMVLCNSLYEQRLREWYGDDDEQAFTAFDIETYLRERIGR